LIEHLFKIEENNLFNINFAQNEEAQLEIIKKRSEDKLAKMKLDLEKRQAEIEDQKATYDI